MCYIYNVTNKNVLTSIMQTFEDGITNKIIGFFDNNEPGNMVLIRINGCGTEAFLDRAKEVVL